MARAAGRPFAGLAPRGLNARCRLHDSSNRPSHALRYPCRHEHVFPFRTRPDHRTRLDPHPRRHGAPGRHRGGAQARRRRHAGAADAPRPARGRHPQRCLRLSRRLARPRRCTRQRPVQRAGRRAGQRAAGPACGRAGLLVCGAARMLRGGRAAVCRGTGPQPSRCGAAGRDRHATRRAEPARADDGLDLPALRHPPGGRAHRLPRPLADAAGRAQALTTRASSWPRRPICRWPARTTTRPTRSCG